jgi:hypothetical protein
MLDKVSRMPPSKATIYPVSVIPAEAGIHMPLKFLDSGSPWLPPGLSRPE